MRIKHLLISVVLIAAIGCSWNMPSLYGQKPKPKSTKPKGAQETIAASSIPEEEMENYRQQATQIVQFLESTLNFLADKSNTVKEKETIINQSYLKFFWNDKVQVEDDLDEKRLVPLYKDIQAYLTDVDFFFKSARFAYQVQDVSVQSSQAGNTYFRVTANRTLNGINVDGDSVSSNKVRYIEINYDDSKKQIKIVSIYTTKLNEKEDLRNWWNTLPHDWQLLLGHELKVADGIMLSDVTHYNDTVAIVNGFPVPMTDSRIYGLFLKIVDSKSIDLSDNQIITSIEPLVKLSNLISINLSGTRITDLMPLRNLNGLEEIDLSQTNTASLEPLKYCNHIRVLKLRQTRIPDISIATSFSALEFLDIGHTAVSDLSPLADRINLQVLLLAETPIKTLQPLANLTKLRILDFSDTQVITLEPLQSAKSLEIITFNNTKVSSLEPLSGLPLLHKVYCDQTSIRNDKAVQFMIDHPGVMVSFATTSLEKWWNTMPASWQKIFYLYRQMDPVPTREQLHFLMTIDSLNINGRQELTSLDPVAQLPRLRWLDCSLSPITSLEPLTGLLHLQYLNARSTGVVSVKPLGTLVNLKYLNIDNDKVTDISPLYRLLGLELILADNTGLTQQAANDFMDKNPGCLVISQTYENSNWWKTLPDTWKNLFREQINLKDTEPDKFALQRIANLKQLVIADNPAIVSLNPVTFLSRLEELRFSDTRVVTLEPISRMVWLKRLICPKNGIVDLLPVSGLTQLIELNVENTQVEDLTPIGNLLNLEILKISGSQVKTLKAIKSLRKLQVVEMYNTRISKIDELNDMPDLKLLKIFNTKISAKRVDKFKELHPQCEVIYY